MDKFYEADNHHAAVTAKAGNEKDCTDRHAQTTSPVCSQVCPGEDSKVQC